MKKIVLSGLVFMLSILLFSACGINESVTQETKKAETMLTNAEKIIGEWNIVGESEETDSGEQLYEYYDEPGGSWIFYENGEYVAGYSEVENYTYTVERDTFIKSYDENGEYEGFDLKISWQGDELILAEYWRESYYDEPKDKSVYDEYGPYAEKDDHDFYILRRKE